MKIKAQFNSRELEILTALLADYDSRVYNLKEDVKKHNDYILNKLMISYYKEITDLKIKFDYLSNRLWEKKGNEKRNVRKKI